MCKDNNTADVDVKLDHSKTMAGAMHTVMDGILPGWYEDPSTQDTPARFVKYLQEFHQPIDIDKVFGSVFKVPDEHHSMVMQANIPFRMICEHHLLPATGKAAIGYVPRKRVIGLSKLTRLVQSVGTERPSLQEHILERIQELLHEHLEPQGTMIVIKATHGCMACRGVNAPGVVTTTSTVKGVFRDNSEARMEMLSLIQSEMKMGA